METKPKTHSFYAFTFLAAVIIFLCDQVGFLNWYKDIRSFIELPFIAFTHTSLQFTSFSVSSLWNGQTLQEENNELKGRILELQKQIADQNQQLASYQEIADLRKTLAALPYKQTETASILDQSVDHVTGKLLLNKGQADGVAPGMIVTYKDYYVGYIAAVSAYTSACDSLFYPGQTIVGYVVSRKVSGTINTTISGTTLTDILATETIKNNDIVSIQKSGYPYYFPVGVISSIQGGKGSAERVGTITPFINLDTMSFVTIVEK